MTIHNCDVKLFESEHLTDEGGGQVAGNVNKPGSGYSSSKYLYTTINDRYYAKCKAWPGLFLTLAFDPGFFSFNY